MGWCTIIPQRSFTYSLTTIMESEAVVSYPQDYLIKTVCRCDIH